VSAQRVKAAVLQSIESTFPLPRERFANLIHPSAQIAHQHRMDRGIHIEPGCIVAPFAEIGFGVSLRRGATIGHHARIGSCEHQPGVQVAGHSRIGRGTTLESAP
jgi:UDP-3-O-[3-hydroxymyristoyl] glucosamine N-acyltransferase